ncbi:MAG: tetratricopeptide repeat protein [Candidatus Rifleibacteriota bacterium]
MLVPAAVPAAMDFVFEESLSQSLSRLEKLYLDGQYDEAMNIARGIIKDSPQDHPAGRRAKDLIVLSLDAKNKQILDQQNRENMGKKRESAQKYLADGSKLLTEKKYKAAADNFREAMRLHPGDAQCYFLLGYASLKAGDKKTAYGSFLKCLKIDEKHTRALFHISGLCFEFKKFDEAEKFSKNLIRQIIARMTELRQVLLTQKEKQLNDKAIETTRKITSLRQNLGQASNLYGILMARKGDHKAAIDSLNRAVKINPTSPEIWLQLGKSYLQQKIFHQATVAIEQSIFIRETKLREIRENAGKLLDAGKSDAAVDAELQTRKLKTQIADSLYTLAIANGKIKDTATALENIEKAIEYRPDFIQARYAKAVLLAERSKLDEALEQMREVLKNAPPKSSQAKQAIKTITYLMGMVAKRDNPDIIAESKPIAKAVEVNEFVKDMPGIGGKASEKDWEQIFLRLKDIKQLFVMRNYAEAIRRLLYLRTKHPEVADIHAILGQCYMEQGRIEDARDCFAKAIEVDPNHAEALADHAYMLATLESNLPLALEQVNRALSIDGMRAEFHHSKGWILFKTGEVKKGIASYLQAVQLKPDYVVARYHLGLAYYIDQNFTAALDCFEQVIAVSPSHHKAWLFKAISLARQKKAEDALVALEALREKLPAESTLARVVGDLHARIKLANERHADLPVPEIKNPAPIEKLLAEAAVYRKKGLVNHAKEKYLECQRLAPERFEPHFELGEMYAAAGLNQPALSAWERARKLKPDHYQLELNMGKMYHKLGDREKARKNFNQAMTLDERDPEPRYYLGLIAYEDKNFESAESHALAALRQKENYFKAMALLGMARIKLNRLKPARDIYESLYAKAPADSSIKRHARKKIWELTRMMAPAMFPSVEDAMEVKDQLVQKVSGAGADKEFKPSPSDEEAFKAYGKNTMTVDDKIWVLKQLEKFSSVATPAPAAPLRRKTTEQTFSSKEKQWLVDRLQKFDSQSDRYALPPDIKVDKYSIKATSQVAERTPDKSDQFVTTALEYAEKGFIDLALKELEQARSVSPENLEVLVNIGYINTILGNFKDAFASFAQASVSHPDDPLPKLALGNLYWLGGQAEKAIEQWKQSKGPIKLDGKFNLIARSEKVWKRVLEVNGVDIDAHSNLGLAYLFSGRFQQALTEFQAVTSLDKNRNEHDFYAAQAYVILYLHNNNKAMKKEANSILSRLKKGPEPFPHSEKLQSFLGSI